MSEQSSNFSALPLLVSPRQVMQFSGLSKGKTYQLFHQEGFPKQMFGKLLLVNKYDLMRYLEKPAAQSTGGGESV